MLRAEIASKQAVYTLGLLTASVSPVCTENLNTGVEAMKAAQSNR